MDNKYNLATTTYDTLYVLSRRQQDKFAKAVKKQNEAQGTLG